MAEHSVWPVSRVVLSVAEREWVEARKLDPRWLEVKRLVGTLVCEGTLDYRRPPEAVMSGAALLLQELSRWFEP